MKDHRPILALDPANITGYAHSAGHRGVWVLGAGPERLQRLRDFITDAFRAWGFKLVAFEGSSFGSHNQATKAAHNELRGVIRLVAADLRAETVEYNPLSIKAWACGNGHAKKDQMIRAAKTMLGIVTDSDNIADAAFILAMAQAGYVVEGKKAKVRKARARRKKDRTLF